MIEKAVIDRFEGEFAILIVGVVEKKINVLRQNLPKDSREGLWLIVEFQGDALIHVEIDQSETDTAKLRIAEKLARLRRGDHITEDSIN